MFTNTVASWPSSGGRYECIIITRLTAHSHCPPFCCSTSSAAPRLTDRAGGSASRQSNVTSSFMWRSLGASRRNGDTDGVNTNKLYNKYRTAAQYNERTGALNEYGSYTPMATAAARAEDRVLCEEALFMGDHWWIGDRLLVSNVQFAKQVGELKRLGVTHVLNCADTMVNVHSAHMSAYGQNIRSQYSRSGIQYMGIGERCPFCALLTRAHHRGRRHARLSDTHTLRRCERVHWPGAQGVEFVERQQCRTGTLHPGQVAIGDGRRRVPDGHAPNQRRSVVELCGHTRCYSRSKRCRR